MKKEIFLLIWKAFVVMVIGIFSACDNNDRITEQDALMHISQAKICLEKDSISDNDSILDVPIKYFTIHEDNERLAECYYLQGEMFNRNRFYLRASESYAQAMLYAEGNERMQGHILLRQAVISRFKMVRQAEEEYLSRAYRIALELKDSLLMAEIMHEKALSELKRKPQKGLHYMSEALIWLPQSEQEKRSIYLRDLSMFFLTVGDPNNALKTARDISCEGWNSRERISLDILKGAIYARLGKADSAKICYQMHRDSLTLRGQVSACRGLYELYQANGDVNQAAKYAAQYILLKDSLDADRRAELSERIRIVDDLRVQHERASHAENALSRQKIIFYRIVVSTMFVIFILLGRLFYVRRKRLRLYERLQTERVARMDESLKRQDAEMALMREQAERKAREVEQLNQTFAYYKQLNAITIPELLNRKNKQGALHLTEKDWQTVVQNTDACFGKFTERLKSLCPQLTEEEIRFCCLVKMSLPLSLLAEIYHIAKGSISRKKMRLKEKLGVEQVSFDEFIDAF